MITFVGRYLSFCDQADEENLNRGFIFLTRQFRSRRTELYPYTIDAFTMVLREKPFTLNSIIECSSYSLINALLSSSVLSDVLSSLIFISSAFSLRPDMSHMLLEMTSLDHIQRHYEDLSEGLSKLSLKATYNIIQTGSHAAHAFYSIGLMTALQEMFESATVQTKLYVSYVFCALLQNIDTEHIPEILSHPLFTVILEALSSFNDIDGMRLLHTLAEVMDDSNSLAALREIPSMSFLLKEISESTSNEAYSNAIEAVLIKL